MEAIIDALAHTDALITLANMAISGRLASALITQIHSIRAL